MTLLSLLLPLTSTSPAPILGPLGRPASAWFLGQLTRQRPAHPDRQVAASRRNLLAAWVNP